MAPPARRCGSRPLHRGWRRSPPGHAGRRSPAPRRPPTPATGPARRGPQASARTRGARPGAPASRRVRSSSLRARPGRPCHGGDKRPLAQRVRQVVAVATRDPQGAPALAPGAPEQPASPAGVPGRRALGLACAARSPARAAPAPRTPGAAPDSRTRRPACSRTSTAAAAAPARPAAVAPRPAAPRPGVCASSSTAVQRRLVGSPAGHLAGRGLRPRPEADARRPGRRRSRAPPDAPAARVSTASSSRPSR